MRKTGKDILDAARDIVLEEGFHALSMRKVGTKVGVSATAVYRHYESKEALLTRVLEDGFELFSKYLTRAQEGGTAEERFLLGGHAYLDFALEQPRYYQLIFMLPLIEWRGAIPEQDKVGVETFDILIRMIDECMDAGVLRRDDPEAVAKVIWSFSHGLVSLYLSGRLDDDEESFRELYMNSTARLLTGLGAENTIAQPID